MTTAQLSEFRQVILELTDDKKVNELFNYVGKLERLKEVVDQYREVINDEYSSHSEKTIAFEKLTEVCDEYDIFLDNARYISH